MTKTLILNALLPTEAEVSTELASSENFADFYQQTLKCSGIDPALVDTKAASYSYTDAQGALHLRKRFDDIIWAAGERLPLATLLQTQLAFDRKRIIHAIWTIENFTALKSLVSVLGAVVRYGLDENGTTTGQVMFADALLPMIESVERREYVLANGEMASDAITRTLGLRAKVFALDRSRRLAQDESSLFSRLTRSLAVIKR